jgi:bidirectional [NiFe] hydrogenase diaphorase subunit
VAIEGQSKLQPACCSEALEGQVVATDTADLRAWRRLAVELFFAEGNHICAICVASGACELQDLAVAVGMDHSRFPYQYPCARWMPPTPVQPGCQPLHSLQPLRAGLRRAGGGPGLGHRRSGPPLPLDRWPGPTLGEVEACTSCGQCVEACPTGALVHKPDGTAETQPHRAWANPRRRDQDHPAGPGP